MNPTRQEGAARRSGLYTPVRQSALEQGPSALAVASVSIASGRIGTIKHTCHRGAMTAACTATGQLQSH